MDFKALKRRFRLFDETGLDAETVHILRLLIAAVSFGIVWTNVTTGVALTSYFKALGASDGLYGLVFALPALANAFQFACSYILERTLRPRKMILVSGLIQRLIWIPLALIPFIVPMEMGAVRLIAAVVMALVSASMAPFVNLSFYTIATAVPMRIRGRYFATRSRVSTLVGLVMGLVVGALLDALPGFTAYAVVFCLAGLFGAADILCYLSMREMPMRPSASGAKLLPMLKSVIKDRDYMRTVLILTAWLFAVQMTSPYHNVYSRSVLGLSNFGITFTGQVASNLFLIFFVSRWGRAIDVYGSRPVLLVAAFLTSLYPLMWTAMGGPLSLVFIFLSNAWSGGIYCAVDLTLQHLFMGQAKEQNRPMYFAVYFLFTQLFGMALGSSVGGMLLDNVFILVEPLNIALVGVPFTRYNAMFLVGGLLRMGVTLFLITRLRDECAQPTKALLAGGKEAVLRRAHELRAAWTRRKLRRALDAEPGACGDKDA